MHFGSSRWEHVRCALFLYKHAENDKCRMIHMRCVRGGGSVVHIAWVGSCSNITTFYDEYHLWWAFSSVEEVRAELDCLAGNIRNERMPGTFILLYCKLKKAMYSNDIWCCTHDSTRLSGLNWNWVSHPVEPRRSERRAAASGRPPLSSNGTTSTKLIKSNMIFLFVHMPLVSPFRLFIACHFSRSSSMSLRALSSVLCLPSPARTARTQEVKLRRKHTIETEKRSLLVCLHYVCVVYCLRVGDRIRCQHVRLVNGVRWTLAPFPISYLFNYYYQWMHRNFNFFFSAILTKNVSQIVGERLAIWLTMMSPKPRCGRNVSNSRFTGNLFSNGFLFVFSIYLNRFCTKE